MLRSKRLLSITRSRPFSVHCSQNRCLHLLSTLSWQRLLRPLLASAAKRPGGDRHQQVSLWLLPPLRKRNAKKKIKSGALRGPCGAGDAQSRGGAAKASPCRWQWGTAKAPLVPHCGSSPAPADAGLGFGMDAAQDAGCPSNGCYGKHFVGEISSRIHVSVIVFGRVPLRPVSQARPAPHRAGCRHVCGGLSVPGSAFPGFSCWVLAWEGVRGP